MAGSFFKWDHAINYNGEIKGGSINGKTDMEAGHYTLPRACGYGKLR